MHVIIKDGNQVFECETNYLEGEAKALCNELIEGTLEMLGAIFEKFEQPTINTFEKVE